MTDNLDLKILRDGHNLSGMIIGSTVGAGFIKKIEEEMDEFPFPYTVEVPLPCGIFRATYSLFDFEVPDFDNPATYHGHSWMVEEGQYGDGYGFGSVHMLVIHGNSAIGVLRTMERNKVILHDNGLERINTIVSGYALHLYHATFGKFDNKYLGVEYGDWRDKIFGDVKQQVANWLSPEEAIKAIWVLADSDIDYFVWAMEKFYPGIRMDYDEFRNRQEAKGRDIEYDFRHHVDWVAQIAGPEKVKAACDMQKAGMDPFDLALRI